MYFHTASVSIFFFFMKRRLPLSTLFPYTTLFRSAVLVVRHREIELVDRQVEDPGIDRGEVAVADVRDRLGLEVLGDDAHRLEDRKSTRLNSSHANISYAVLCLQKKIGVKVLRVRY